MSLNHQLPGRMATGVTSGTLWDLQRFHDREHWYESFNGPLARVAAMAMGINPGDVHLATFAADHVVFTELCPYASKSFGLDPTSIAELVSSDAAFQTAARIRTTLLDHAQPALVLVKRRQRTSTVPSGPRRFIPLGRAAQGVSVV